MTSSGVRPRWGSPPAPVLVELAATHRLDTAGLIRTVAALLEGPSDVPDSTRQPDRASTADTATRSRHLAAGHTPAGGEVTGRVRSREG
ncbi:hypothetical protein [Actinophytocola sp.]|uniref:hypothetical protein n=1 Tax=Actinophytocola sp. TaxID=1872138 RepID=UPI00389B1D10